MSLISFSKSGNGFICSLSLILNLSIWTHVQKLAGQWTLKLKQWALTFSIILQFQVLSFPKKLGHIISMNTALLIQSVQ